MSAKKPDSPTLKVHESVLPSKFNFKISRNKKIEEFEVAPVFSKDPFTDQLQCYFKLSNAIVIECLPEVTFVSILRPHINETSTMDVFKERIKKGRIFIFDPVSLEVPRSRFVKSTFEPSIFSVAKPLVFF